MNKKLLITIKVAIIAAWVVGLSLFLFFVPTTLYGVTLFEPSDLFIRNAMYFMYAAFVVCAIPCFIALVLGWKILKHLESNTILTRNCADLIHKLYVLAIFDVIVLTAYIVIANILNMLPMEIGLVLIIIAGLGVIFALIFKVIHIGLKQAIEIREESELTI